LEDSISDKLNLLGIKGFIIITKDGIPVIERIYDETLDIGTDTFLTAGFLSAFARFADEHVSGLLSDIGLHTYRLFFDYDEHLMFLLIYDEMKMSDLPVSEFLMLFKGTMSEIKSLIREFFLEESRSSLKKMIENPKSLEALSSMLQNVSPQFDRILFKSHNMLMKLIKNIET
jgi:predicted regulator of Ras-like GTPase activity (Roadblock/LC7/MglB family)